MIRAHKIAICYHAVKYTFVGFKICCELRFPDIDIDMYKHL